MSEKKQEKIDKKTAKAAVDKEVEKCKAELKASEEKLEAKDLEYKKLFAEFDTFRRRTIEDGKSLKEQAAADVIKGMLGVLDQCEIALQTLDTSSDEAAKEGTRLIYGNLLTYLKSKGLSVIEAVGEDFNTDFHEAIMMQPSEDEKQKGKVIIVARTGYMFAGKVIRHAQVIVGA